MNKKSAHTKRPSKQKESQACPLQDNRNPLARARDEWLESAEGQVATSVNILRHPNQQQFLENRLVGAFIAGANWATNDHAFTQGYVCAVAALVSGHGADTMARDVLRCNTPSDWSIIDDHDREILANAGLAPRRRKSRKAKSVGRGGDKV